MCDNVETTDGINELLSEVMSKNDSTTSAIVKFSPGSQAGDGYGSKTLAVDIEDGDKSLNLFLKSALPQLRENALFNQIYATEILFYKTIYPTYQKFLKDKGVNDGFHCVPKCYALLEKVGYEILALENLRRRNFTLFNTFTFMNDKHLSLLFESYAKFHAISFAMKDQHREIHDSFLDGRTSIFNILKVISFDKVIVNVVNEFVSKLDPEEDKDILDRCENLAANTVNQVTDVDNYLSDYSILTKGDCWINNMMFLYEAGNEERPIDVMLLDWQGVCRGSPVHDLGALFLQVSSEEALNHYRFYLNLYYDELSKRIRKLGSNPEVLYPRHVLEAEWVKYGLHSLGLGFLAVKTMMCAKSNVPVLKVENPDELSSAANTLFGSIRGNDEEVLRRWKFMARYLIKICVL